MDKLMSLDKQLELKAQEWFINKQEEKNIRLAKKYFNENKKEVIKEYLDKHPKRKKEYETKKKAQLKLLLLAGGLAVTTLGGAYLLNKENELKQNEVEVENEVDLNQTTLQEEIEEPKEESRNYEEFFKQARQTENTKKREELISDYTKEIIVEAYNKEHLENQITTEELETFILNEIVLKKTDKLGNYTYERIPQKEKITPKENEELVRIGTMYDFRINGKTVAVFDGNKNVIPDKNVEKQDMSFIKAIELMQKSEELKNIYKYENGRYVEIEMEEEYKESANQLLEEDKQNEHKEIEIG